MTQTDKMVISKVKQLLFTKPEFISCFGTGVTLGYKTEDDKFYDIHYGYIDSDTFNFPNKAEFELRDYNDADSLLTYENRKREVGISLRTPIGKSYHIRTSFCLTDEIEDRIREIVNNALIEELQ